jgi:membrane-associated phospholipid phosphatase
MLMNMVSDSGLVRTVTNGVGFPSSHSTNSVSIALYFAQWMLEEREAMGSTALIGGLACMTFELRLRLC